MNADPPEVIPVSGFAKDEFAPLANILGRVVASQGGGGAALAVYRGSELVVDVVAGDYATDTLQLIYSISKAVTAIAAGMAVRDGQLDLDAPIAEFWPEFGKPSTALLTPRIVMSHAAGLPVLTEPVTFDDLLKGRDEDVIARAEPAWVPGTKHGYHSFTYGTLMGGIFRRALGTSVGDFVASRIAKPLGLDLFIGLPSGLISRTTPTIIRPTLLTSYQADRLARTPADPNYVGQALTELPLGYDDPRYMTACFPASSGVTDARSLARLFAATMYEIDGVRLLNDDLLADMTAPQVRGYDETLGISSTYGTGFELAFPQFPMLGARSFGHEAGGGSLGFGDSEHGISVGFTSNVFPSMHGSSAGALALLASIRHCMSVDASTLHQAPRKPRRIDGAAAAGAADPL